MPELIAKEPTELEKIEKLEYQVMTLEAKIQEKDTEIKKLKVKAKKQPSIGYFRTRFKGG